VTQQFALWYKGNKGIGGYYIIKTVKV